MLLNPMMPQERNNDQTLKVKLVKIVDNLFSNISAEKIISRDKILLYKL